MYKISARRITLLSEGQTKQKIKQDKKQKTKQNETKNHCLHWVKLKFYNATFKSTESLFRCTKFTWVKAKQNKQTTASIG